MIRVMILGSARTGTTLLQRIVSAPQELLAVEESHFLFNRYVCPLDRLPLPVDVSDALYFHRFQTCALQKGLLLGPATRYQARDARSYFEMLDEKAERNGYAGWVEKSTPNIRRMFTVKHAGVKLHWIYIVRRFPPVLASWQRLAREHPGSIWSSASGRQVFRNWCRDMDRALMWMKSSNLPGLVVSYSFLCRRTECFIDELNSITGLVHRAADVMTSTVPAYEGEQIWKSKAQGKIGEPKEFDLIGSGEHERRYQGFLKEARSLSTHQILSEE